MNVLMVDDEPFVLEQLEYLIKEYSPIWHLYKAGDSSQVQELIQKVHFQLAFLDIELPGKSGLEIAQDLKEHYPDMEIAMLTAHQQFNFAQQSIKIGVSAYITKPIIKEDIMEIVQHFPKNEHSDKEYSTMILKTLELINQRYQEKMTLSDLGNAIHVNTSYLSRKFKQETGLAFSDYLNNYRLEMAKNLLTLHGHYSISEVAEKTGFNSLHYFSTNFKKNTGVSPKQFQQNIRDHKNR